MRLRMHVARQLPEIGVNDETPIAKRLSRNCCRGLTFRPSDAGWTLKLKRAPRQLVRNAVLRRSGQEAAEFFAQQRSCTAVTGSIFGLVMPFRMRVFGRAGAK